MTTWNARTPETNAAKRAKQYRWWPTDSRIGEPEGWGCAMCAHGQRTGARMAAHFYRGRLHDGTLAVVFARLTGTPR